ncbi:MAG TPA: hypothetical protein VGA98_09710 [Allosphingosinicella sp.]
MCHDFNFSDVLAGSAKAAWQVEDVLPVGARLGFGRRFGPNSMRQAPCSSAA